MKGNAEDRATCIFCDGLAVGAKMTGEHIWSDWMKKKRLIRVGATDLPTMCK